MSSLNKQKLIDWALSIPEAAWKTDPKRGRFVYAVMDCVYVSLHLSSYNSLILNISSVYGDIGPFDLEDEIDNREYAAIKARISRIRPEKQEDKADLIVKHLEL